MGGEGGGGENMAAKPKAPRVKKEKKEPGQCRNHSVTQRLSQCAAVKMTNHAVCSGHAWMLFNTTGFIPG